MSKIFKKDNCKKKEDNLSNKTNKLMKKELINFNIKFII